MQTNTAEKFTELSLLQQVTIFVVRVLLSWEPILELHNLIEIFETSKVGTNGRQIIAAQKEPENITKREQI